MSSHLWISAAGISVSLSELVCMMDCFKLAILIWKWVLIGFDYLQFGGMCWGPMMRLMKLI